MRYLSYVLIGLFEILYFEIGLAGGFAALCEHANREFGMNALCLAFVFIVPKQKPCV